MTESACGSDCQEAVDVSAPTNFPFVIVAVSSGNGRGSTSLVDALQKELAERDVRSIRLTCLMLADKVIECARQTQNARAQWRQMTTPAAFFLRTLRYNIADAHRIGVSSALGANTLYQYLGDIADLAGGPMECNVVLVDDVRYFDDYKHLKKWGAKMVRIRDNAPRGNCALYAKYADETGCESTDLRHDSGRELHWDAVLTKRHKPNKLARDLIAELGLAKLAKAARKRATELRDAQKEYPKQ